MRVLLVEDDGPCAELLSLRLAQLGFEVLQAQDAESALDLAREHPLDLVLSDLKLGSDGFAGEKLIRRLREMPALTSVPILVHSVYMHHLSDLPELAPFVDGVLPKPFAFKQLRALIADVLPLSQAS
ncbi:MAG TPA: response regulator [Oscillatoriaceae cyanobacterium]